MMHWHHCGEVDSSDCIIGSVNDDIIALLIIISDLTVSVFLGVSVRLPI